MNGAERRTSERASGEITVSFYVSEFRMTDTNCHDHHLFRTTIIYVTFTDPDLHRRAGELLSLHVLSEDALLSVFSAGASSASVTPDSRGEGEPSLSDRAAQALNYVYYFQPDHVLSKLNEWLVDPGVHDALAADRI